MYYAFGQVEYAGQGGAFSIVIQHPFSSRGRAALSTTASSSGKALKSRIVIHHPFLDYSALVVVAVEVWH